MELRPRGVRGANGHHTQAEDEPGGSVDNRSDDNAKVLKLARQVGAEPLESARDVGEVACRTADVREAPANATRPRSWLEMKRVHQLLRRWGYTLPFRITFVMTAMISETDGRFRKRHDLISESARSNSRNTPAVKENHTNVFPETHGLIPETHGLIRKTHGLIPKTHGLIPKHTV